MADPAQEQSGASRLTASIGKPLRLPIRVASEVAYKSIKVRLSRSLVTVSSVVLAVAFLLTILGAQLNTSAVHQTFSADYQPIVDSQVVRAALAGNRSDIELIAQLADPVRYQPSLTWCGLEQAPDSASFAATIQLVDWTDDLKVTDRYKLIGLESGLTWSLNLQSEDIAPLLSEVSTLGAEKPPFDAEVLQQLASISPQRRDTLAAMRTAERQRHQLISDQGASNLGLSASGYDVDLLALSNRIVTDQQQLGSMGLPLDLLLPGIKTPQRLQALAEQLEREHGRNQVNSLITDFNRQSSNDLRQVRSTISQSRSDDDLLRLLIAPDSQAIISAWGQLEAQTEVLAVSQVDAMRTFIAWYDTLPLDQRDAWQVPQLGYLFTDSGERLSQAQTYGCPQSVLDVLLPAYDDWQQAIRILAKVEAERMLTVRQRGTKALMELLPDQPAEQLMAFGIPLDQLFLQDMAQQLAGVRELLIQRERPVTLQVLFSGAAPTAQAAVVSTMGAESYHTVVAAFFERQRLDNLQATFIALEYEPDGDNSRTFWLIVLSLLVCIVGIVNSMMMAVTERFREIATMKCLGAMDSFILKAFLIESGSVGLVGSFLGAILGLVVVIIQSWFGFGHSLWPSLPLLSLIGAMALALVCGLVLTIVGALLPAYRAARMHPIEAMRLES